MPAVAPTAMTESLESLRSHEVLLVGAAIETGVESENNSEEAGEKLCFPFLFRNTKLFFFADACFVPLFLFTEEREQGRHALLVPVHGAQARK